MIVFGERCDGDTLMVTRFSSILIALRTNRDLNYFLLKHPFARNIAPTPKILIFKLDKNKNKKIAYIQICSGKVIIIKV